MSFHEQVIADAQPKIMRTSHNVHFQDMGPVNDFSHSEAESAEASGENSVDFCESEDAGGINTSASIWNNSVLLHSFSRDGTSWLGGALIMANVCIGMGMLNFPRAIAEAGGLLNAGIISLVFVSMIALSLMTTAYCCRFYGCVSYQDMVVTHLGERVGIICRICLLLETCGSCIVKLVVFADQLQRVTRIIFGDDAIHKWYLRRAFVMPIVTSVTVLPVCLLKNFQIFKYTSFFGIVAAAYIAFGVALTRYITGVETVHPHVDPVHTSSNLVGILPLLVFAFHGHIEAPVVFCCLRKNRIFYFMRMVYVYLFVAFLLYTMVAVFGHLTFGNFVDVDYLLSFPNDDWVANVAMIFIILKLFTSFPVIFYILRSVIDDFWRRYILHTFPRALPNFEVRRVVQTVFLFAFVCTIAAMVPDMASAIDLIGGISCNFAFTFPGLCFLKLHINKDQKILKNRIRVIIGAIFIIVGAFLTGTNTTIAIQQYIHK